MAQVELVGREFNPRAKAGDAAAEPAKPKAKGVGGRLRAAAERLRGKKEEPAAQSKEGAESRGAKEAKDAKEPKERKGGKAAKSRAASNKGGARKGGKKR
jgi:hypothetical protein